jgi:hypothetical protein
VLLTIEGHDHVGIQIGKQPDQVVKAAGAKATFTAEVELKETPDGVDFRGPAVQGKRGDRFVYLTWGNRPPGGEFAMFRRLKLMLAAVDPTVIAKAQKSGCLTARLPLTDAKGGPSCSTARPPAVSWSA